MRNENEFYYTIQKSYGPEEIKEKGSRFISYLYPSLSAEEADSLLTKLRKKYYDSTHVCFAYRLGNGREEYIRYSDDGEPGGTAGLPIFNEIKNKDYYNILAAVIRYFGGTKLGTGGLVRAYSGAAKKIIDIADTVTIFLKKESSLDFPYDLTGEIMHVVNHFSLEIINREYTDLGISMKLAIPIGSVKEVSRVFSDISNGRLILNIKQEE